MSSAACPTPQHFFALSQKRRDSPPPQKKPLFKKLVLNFVNKLCVFIFCTILLWNIFLFWEELGEIWSKMHIGLHLKYPLLSDLNETRIFSTYFRKIIKYQISRHSNQWEPICSMRTDGRTDRQADMTKLSDYIFGDLNIVRFIILVFRNWQIAPNKMCFDLIYKFFPGHFLL